MTIPDVFERVLTFHPSIGMRIPNFNDLNYRMGGCPGAAPFLGLGRGTACGCQHDWDNL